MKIEKSQIIIMTDLYEPLDKCSSSEKTELDIGCGKGGFSVALARKYPERNIVAADIMLGRLRKLQNKIRTNKIGNIYLLRVEARFLISLLIPDSSVDRIHILCPDPWPKSRHAAHRLMNSEMAGQISRILKPHGIVHVSTDSPEYLDSIMTVFLGSELFSRDDASVSDVVGIETEFEKVWKNIGRSVVHQGWRKL